MLGDGVETSYHDRDDGALIYKDHIVVRPAGERSQRSSSARTSVHT
jgi:hypothetical protein